MGKIPENQTSLPSDLTEQIEGNVQSYALPPKQTGRRKAAGKGRFTEGKVTPKMTRFTSLSFQLNTQGKNILPMNVQRVYLMFQNKGTGNVYLTFGVMANIDGPNTHTISPGGFYELNIHCPINDVFAVSDGTATLSVQQGVKS